MKKLTARQLVLGVIAALCALVLVVVLVNWVGSGAQTTAGSSPTAGQAGSLVSQTPTSNPTGAVPTEQFGLPVIRESELPPEGRETLELIRDGGPYPYSRDGVNFGNFEGLLPQQRGGFYAEYTVPTPGENTRGARRIVVGDDGTKFYTDDHYGSFYYIQEDA